MKVRQWCLSLLIVVATQEMYSQADTSFDVFPLAVGNEWMYRYSASQEYHTVSFGGFSSDTGKVDYFIQHAQQYGDSTLWNFQMTRNIVRYSSSWYVGQPVRYDTTII